MPIITKSNYRPPRHLWNAHLQTIIPNLRKVELTYERERLTLPDGDFVDLDWRVQGSQQLVLLAHGLEGDSYRTYMKAPARLFFENGWDVLAWNCRSCSGELNRKLRLYHHGEIEDIASVIAHILHTKSYDQIALVGFSMGGSIIMKYLGVHGKSAPEAIKSAVAVSSPLDLASSAEVVDAPLNWIYRHRFYNSLVNKVKLKAKRFPGVFPLEKLPSVKSWREFDEHFSAPMNGFSSADELYYSASASNFMAGIQRPTLLLNAQNDPLVTAASSPRPQFEKHPFAFLENPRRGGHVGFPLWRKPYAWSELRALEFVTAHSC